MNVRNRGFTLMEMMFAMTIATVVVVTLGITVSRLLLSNETAHGHTQTIATLGRLGEQFRRDAHAARDVAVVDAGAGAATLRFVMSDDESVQYELVPEGLARSMFRGDKPVARDSFLLPGVRPLGWTIDEPRGLVTIELGRLARPASEDATVASRFSITAAVSSRTNPIDSR